MTKRYIFMKISAVQHLDRRLHGVSAFSIVNRDDSLGNQMQRYIQYIWMSTSIKTTFTFEKYNAKWQSLVMWCDREMTIPNLLQE